MLLKKMYISTAIKTSNLDTHFIPSVGTTVRLEIQITIHIHLPIEINLTSNYKSKIYD
jgi:hypothetical protein